MSGVSSTYAATLAAAIAKGKIVIVPKDDKIFLDIDNRD